MKLAALILAHENKPQLDRLVTTLKEEGFHVFIHIDKKSQDLKVGDYENAISLFRVAWGGYSTIKATLALFQLALNIKADYYFLISGSDYLLQPRKLIEQKLSNGGEFVHWWKMPAPFWGADGGFERLERWYFQALRQRFDRYNLQLLSLQRKLNIKKKLPADLDFYGGSQWFTLTHSCIEYLVNHSLKFEKIYKYSLLSDESMFQTMILNSKFRSDVVNDNLRLISWEKGPPRPWLWTTDDLPELTSSDKILARKFTYNAALLDALDNNRKYHQESISASKS